MLALSEEWLENISPSLQNHLITSEALEFWQVWRINLLIGIQLGNKKEFNIHAFFTLFVQNLTDPKVVKKSIFLQQAWKLFFGLRRHGIETDEEDNDAFLTQLHSYFMNVTLDSLLDGFRKVDEVVNSINQLLKVRIDLVYLSFVSNILNCVTL